MNKTELIEELAERTGSSKDEAQKRVEAFASVVAATLKVGKEVLIPGFGKFYAQERDARGGREPADEAEDADPGLESPEVQGGQRAETVGLAPEAGDGMWSGLPS